MLDLLIRGGFIVDGSGQPGFSGDVGVREGRIVAVGDVDETADRVVDAEGRVVCPGFIDVHTHYDAQLFWDPTASPSALHGVTTVIGGNCGISLAPLHPEDDFLLRLLSRVEAIPLESLTAGVTPCWSSFPEFLDVVESMGKAVNVGFLAGHSSIRRFVMGEEASTGAASAAHLDTMRRFVDEALAAGALGFSSSTASTQFDGDGRPTPPTFAARDELVALAAVCREHPGTSVEFIPASAGYGFDDDGDDLRLMAEMSAGAQRHLNWNTVLFKYPGMPDIQDRQLRSADVGAELGAAVVPMVIPHNFRVRTDFLESDVGFRTIPAFGPLFDLPIPERLSALRSERLRADLAAIQADAGAGPNAMFLASLDEQLVSDVGRPSLEHLVGTPVREVAARRGSDVLTTILDLAVEAELDIGFVRHLVPVATPDQRALRRRVLRDPRVVLGASDGGAHVRGVLNVEYSTASFAELVREEDVFTIEELVREFTDVPARLYGMRDRGRLRPGCWADVVIFDAERIAPSAVALRRDLPAGAARLYSTGVGIDAVFVAGEDIVRSGQHTEARPGRLLRSGRDTLTTPLAEARDLRRALP
jgi:N-acyl-D-aspartate/D-glutamate deacylase